LARAEEGLLSDGKDVNLADPSLIVDEKAVLANVVITIEVPGAEAKVPTEPLIVRSTSSARSSRT